MALPWDQAQAPGLTAYTLPEKAVLSSVKLTVLHPKRKGTPRSLPNRYAASIHHLMEKPNAQATLPDFRGLVFLLALYGPRSGGQGGGV